MIKKRSARENEPRYARASDVAEYLRIGRSTVYEWARILDGFPQPKKIGPRATVFDLNEVDEFMRHRMNQQPIPKPKCKKGN